MLRVLTSCEIRLQTFCYVLSSRIKFSKVQSTRAIEFEFR